MRTLSFIVDKQNLKPDPSCNFDGLVPGTEGYIQAYFSFSPDWAGCAKVVMFSSMLGREYPPEVLMDGKTCMIPAAALKNSSFKIKLLGRRTGFTITTNKIVIHQNGG